MTLPRRKVLIVDDSAMVRRVLTAGMASEPRLEVVGAAASAEAARGMIESLSPDVITLDLDLPGTDGISFLRSYMNVRPIPTVVISAFTRRGAQATMKAFDAGAVDVIEKPAPGDESGLPHVMREVAHRVLAAAITRPRAALAPPAAAPAATQPLRLSQAESWVMALGASTGGVQALTQILPAFGDDLPGIVIVQHMPRGFTASFAQRLDRLARLTVREARDGDPVLPGTALIAPGGDRHMTIIPAGRGYRIQMVEGDPVCFSRPAVDVLFQSVARAAGRRAVAALLTGMGKDGAEGLLAIRRAGGATIAQDAETSMVYGMPLAARELGAAQVIAPLDSIPERMTAAAAAADPAATRRP